MLSWWWKKTGVNGGVRLDPCPIPPTKVGPRWIANLKRKGNKVRKEIRQQNI